MIGFPDPTEYATYYERYIQLLDPATDLLALLRAQPATLRHTLTGLTDAEAAARPAPGKWSIKEALIHVIDTERVFAYRAMALARGEQTPLASFEQDDYVANADVQERALLDLLAEYAAQRTATLALLGGLSGAAQVRRGIAAGHPATARGLAWIIAGHDEHHQRAFARLMHPATEPAA